MDAAPADTPVLAPGKPGWMAIALIAAFVLAAVGVFAVATALVRRSPGPDVSAIAVVPFSNPTTNPGDSPLGTLFARQLAEAVSKAPGLHLVARPQAATLIEGSMQTSKNRVRVAIWLVRASDRRALWSQHYEFSVPEASSVQENIVRAVANALHLQPAAGTPN